MFGPSLEWTWFSTTLLTRWFRRIWTDPIGAELAVVLHAVISLNELYPLVGLDNSFSGSRLLLKITLIDIFLIHALEIFQNFKIVLSVYKSFLIGSLRRTGQKFVFILMVLNLVLLPWNFICLIISVYLTMPLRLVTSMEWWYSPALFFVSFPRPKHMSQLEPISSVCEEYCVVCPDYQTDFHTITQSMLHAGANDIQTTLLSGIFDENRPIVVRSQFGLQLFEIKSSGWKYKVFTVKN